MFRHIHCTTCEMTDLVNKRSLVENCNRVKCDELGRFFFSNWVPKSTAVVEKRKDKRVPKYRNGIERKQASTLVMETKLIAKASLEHASSLPLIAFSSNL